jgi:hypothetical protein
MRDRHHRRTALPAVLDAVRVRGADRIVNLGECVSGPLWPRETMDFFKPWAERRGAAITTAGSRKPRARRWRPLLTKEARSSRHVNRASAQAAANGAAQGRALATGYVS